MASLLDDLRTERIEADYRMDDSRFQEPRTAMMCVEMAQDAKRYLERCCSDVDAIRQGIQQWRLAAGQ